MLKWRLLMGTLTIAVAYLAGPPWFEQLIGVLVRIKLALYKSIQFVDGEAVGFLQHFFRFFVSLDCF